MESGRIAVVVQVTFENVIGWAMLTRWMLDAPPELICPATGGGRIVLWTVAAARTLSRCVT